MPSFWDGTTVFCTMGQNPTWKYICQHQPCLQLWLCGLQYVAEVVLEGLARAGTKSRCTVMGRSAMSLDLQGLQRGLQGIAAGKQDFVVSALRLVDAYIKAYYIPWGPELRRWAITHPEYTQVRHLGMKAMAPSMQKFQSLV